MTKHTIPLRSEVEQKDKWNLSKLYADEKAWEDDLIKLEKFYDIATKFKGKIASSSDNLFECISFLKEFGMLSERLATYAELRQTEDEGSSEARGRYSRFMMIYTKISGDISYITPEIMMIKEDTLLSWMKEARYTEYSIYLSRLIREKAHILSDKEERILALQAETSGISSDTFSTLTNVDMDFGTIKTKDGEKPLSQSSFSVFLQNNDIELRKQAYTQFYNVFDAHKNTLASLFEGSIKGDKYRATVRNFPSCRAKALYPDNVPESVYDNLISTVNANLKALHDYYSLKKDVLNLEVLHHYDVYMSIVGETEISHSYEDAVNVIIKALAPLGEEYTSVLKNGFLNGWVDRYENKGKRSGAFSAGTFKGDPYILMNYKDNVIRDLFTLAHEGGHSMHSWYSVKANPFMHYNYTIFEAEVASTFNEQLVFKHLLSEAKTDTIKAYLINKRIDDLIATLYRQTMFAEYEHIVHSSLEKGIPLTIDFFRAEYSKLQKKYFGPALVFEDTSDLEGLRIPHFYGAFYVYKYATGISASLALANRVLQGGEKERQDYFNFLKSGGSRFPIESLKVAGVDMTQSEPIQSACDEFAKLVKELKILLKK